MIQSGSDEDIPYAASSEQLDEEIEVDGIPSTPLVSSPMPQFTAKEADVEEMEEDEDVDIGSTTLVLNDDYWEIFHPNSPLTTHLHKIPKSVVQTEEIHMGSEEHQASLLTIPEEVPATSADVNVAEEMEAKAAADDIAPEIPQHVAPESMIQAVVKTSTTNLQPKP